jgi:hypothetical protein
MAAHVLVGRTQVNGSDPEEAQNISFGTAVGGQSRELPLETESSASKQSPSHSTQLD